LERWRGVIFDPDGPLVGTLADLADSLNRLLAERGLPVHETPWYRGAVGGGLRELISEALPATRHTPDEIERVLQPMLGQCGEHCLDTTRPYPAVPELLGSLAEHAIPAKIAYVGDSALDMLTARAAGIVPLGASWGFRARKELSQHGAHTVIDHPGELLTLIL